MSLGWESFTCLSVAAWVDEGARCGLALICSLLVHLQAMDDAPGATTSFRSSSLMGPASAAGMVSSIARARMQQERARRARATRTGSLSKPCRIVLHAAQHNLQCHAALPPVACAMGRKPLRAAGTACAAVLDWKLRALEPRRQHQHATYALVTHWTTPTPCPSCVQAPLGDGAGVGAGSVGGSGGVGASGAGQAFQTTYGFTTTHGFSVSSGPKPQPPPPLLQQQQRQQQKQQQQAHSDHPSRFKQEQEQQQHQQRRPDRQRDDAAGEQRGVLPVREADSVRSCSSLSTASTLTAAGALAVRVPSTDNTLGWRGMLEASK